MSTFETQDNRIRQRFVDDYSCLIEEYNFTEPYCSRDLDFTGNTIVNYQVYRVELKERSYTNQYLMDNGAYFEAPKLKHFQELYEVYPSDNLIYFNYTTDGTITYNISNRIRYNSPDLELKLIKGLPQTTLGNTDPLDKMIATLFFNPIYGDKKTIYKNK